MKSQAIVVLSGGITKSGTIPFFVKSRLDSAFQLYHNGVSGKCIVSGKWTYLLSEKPIHTESDSMSLYLQSLGVPEKFIIKESESQDTMSAAYYIKKKICIPLHIHVLTIVVSDFQKDRVKFIFDKVLGPDYLITYVVNESKIPSHLNWEIFVYEKHMLLRTKVFLRGMTVGDHEFLQNKFYDTTFYREKNSGYIKKSIFIQHVHKKKTTKSHYSLRNINKIKQNVFNTHNLTDVQFAKEVEPDFWTGWFLNFLGKDKNDNLYLLKFPLFRKDKTNFSNEIRITELLRTNKCRFVPKLIDQSFADTPSWYLYRVIAGKMTGKFSIYYSYSRHFYDTLFLNQFISHLKKLRTVQYHDIPLYSWSAKKYRENFEHLFKKLLTYPELVSSATLFKTRITFLDKSNLFDTVSTYLSHNDLHPANSIISLKEKKLYFIDFGSVGMNTIAFDFTFAYIQSWDNPTFQKTLYKEFVRSLTPSEKHEFVAVFDLTLLYLLVWLLSYVAKWRGRAGEDRYRQAKHYIFKKLRVALSHFTT